MQAQGIPSAGLPAELDRILALPERPPVDTGYSFVAGRRSYTPETQALVEWTTAKFAIPRAARPDGSPSCLCASLGHPCVVQLNPEQAWSLREIALYGGILGFVPVGGGKTFLGLLAPMAARGVKTAVLLVKSDQRLHYRNAWIRLREHFRVPSLVFDDNSESLIVRGAPTLHLIPYSKLSRPEATKLLESLNPDLIVADECHSLADRKSARTMRFLRYMASRQGLKFCGWSGTLLDKSIRSIGHLSAYALGDQSPVPTNPNNLEAWAAVLDPDYKPDRSSNVAAALFSNFGGDFGMPVRFPFDVGYQTVQSQQDLLLANRIDRVREGFQRRLAVTPGVITSRTASSAASITIRERKISMPPDVAEALKVVRGWMRPDGEELVEAVEQARCAREVASGFFYHWIFGDEPEDLIADWFARRKAFGRELRDKISEGREYLDSRKLCEDAAQRAFQKPPYEGDRPTWWASCWPAWRDIRDKVKHTQGTQWISDYLAADAANWAREHRGIVWCMSSAMGERVAKLAGLPYHGGGPGCEGRILAEDGSRSVIASIKAHSEGRDGLQHKFDKQLVVEVPPGGKVWGQMLGRLCRPGQKSDEIQTWVYVHYEEARDALRKALTQAEFTDEMTPLESLLSAADITFDL